MKFQEIIEVLKLNNTILYPSDTVWGIGCDATSKIAVENVYKLKKRNESKALIVLVSSITMLRRYVEEVPEKVVDIITNSDIPTTIIYNNPIGIAENLCNSLDNTVAIRVVKESFCKQLIDAFDTPIVSTSANISGCPTPKSFSEINGAILTNVDYIVDLQIKKIGASPSRILKVNKGEVIIIRS